MKKLLTAIFCLSLCIALFGCNAKSKSTISVYAPDGAPALALAQMMSENYTTKGYKTQYNVVPSAQIKDKALTADLAIVPSNMASILFNKTKGEYLLVSVNTFGNLYLVGKSGTPSISGLGDLAGKTVYLTGQNGAPDLVFKYLLTQAGVIDSVTLTYRSDGSEIIPLLKNGTAEYAVLGEPAVSQSIAKAGTVQLADLQELYMTAAGTTVSYPQACLIVKKSFAQKHPTYVKAFATKLQGASTWLASNAAAAGTALKDNGSLLNTELFTATTIQRCRIDYLAAPDARNMIEQYFEVIAGFNADLIGGKLPSDDFYYSI